MKKLRGFSFQINGGSYGGFRVNFNRMSWRICLGWIAFTLFFFDVEPVFYEALQVYNGHKRAPGEK